MSLSPPPTTWSAPVRYAEVDQQGVVFNSHYLLYCDEAMGVFCLARGLRAFAERVHLVTSTLTWTAPAHWGEQIQIEVRCTKVGRTSATMVFDVRADERPCCTVETVYVLADTTGIPQPIDEETRASLTS